MKYPSSRRPTASKTSRRIIRLAPATQLTWHSPSGTGALDMAAEDSGDRPEPQAAFEFAQDRREVERRPLRLAVEIFELAPRQANVGPALEELDECSERVRVGRSCRD